MIKYRLFSLAAILLLALAGGASSYMAVDGPVEAFSRASVIDAPTHTCNADCVKAAECMRAGQCGLCDEPCKPCSPEECAAKCGVSVEQVKACMAACETQAQRLVSTTGSCVVDVEEGDTNIRLTKVNGEKKCVNPGL